MRSKSRVQRRVSRCSIWVGSEPTQSVASCEKLEAIRTKEHARPRAVAVLHVRRLGWNVSQAHLGLCERLNVVRGHSDRTASGKCADHTLISSGWRRSRTTIVGAPNAPASVFTVCMREMSSWLTDLDSFLCRSPKKVLHIVGLLCIHYSIDFRVRQQCIAQHSSNRCETRSHGSSGDKLHRTGVLVDILLS